LPNHQGVQNLSSDPVIISLSDQVEKLEVEASFVKSDGDDMEVSFMGVRFSIERDIQAFFDSESVSMTFPPDWFGIVRAFFRNYFTIFSTEAITS